MKQAAEVLTKEAIEFGEHVTLYRIVDLTTGKGTLWHRDQKKAWGHFARLRGTV